MFEKCKQFLNWVTNNPVETVLFIKGFVLAVYAVYFMLPMSLDVAGVINAVFNTQQEHFLIGSALLSPGLYTMYGFIRQDTNVLHTASFMTMVAWSFLTVLRIVVFGFTTVNGWLLFIAPALTTMICYLYLGKKLSKK